MAEDPKRRSSILSALALLSAVFAVDSPSQAASVSSQSLDQLSIEERVQRVRHSVRDLIDDPSRTVTPPHQALQWANWPNWPNWNNWRNWNNWNNWVNWWNG